MMNFIIGVFIGLLIDFCLRLFRHILRLNEEEDKRKEHNKRKYK